MSKELLESLGIDSTLPQRRILELLQDKNIEILERLDNCSDPDRAKQLQAQQREVENAILTLSTAVSLDRMVQSQSRSDAEQPAADQGSSSPEDRYNQALLDYQAGNVEQAIPVLNEFAQEGNVLACMLVGNHLLNIGETDDGKRLLQTAAQAGEGTASLLLAQQFWREGNTVYARSWAKEALDRKIPGSGRILAQISVDEGRHREAIEALLVELDHVSGYDCYAITQDIIRLMNNAGLSATERHRYQTALDAKTAGDSQIQAYIAEEHKQAKSERLSKPRQIAFFAVFSVVLFAIVRVPLSDLFSLFSFEYDDGFPLRIFTDLFLCYGGLVVGSYISYAVLRKLSGKLWCISVWRAFLYPIFIFIVVFFAVGILVCILAIFKTDLDVYSPNGFGVMASVYSGLFAACVVSATGGSSLLSKQN